ncbi:thermonuclease family protein [Acuticoccus mangrovi]|uniref:Thermonuclease family protein n=1 Tax=Acuticoccus mangrovi TaxID=2796142 RepID=A0A934MN06_9HYPH|nr:thermonuclease family protein [Acuticoccus mangrovi]
MRIATARLPVVTLDDGRAVRLADVRVVEGAEPPVGLDGREALLRPLPELDRYGRTVGDIVLKDTTASLSASLVARGLAFVDPVAMSEQCLSVLFAAERRAEAESRGLWAQAGTVVPAGTPNLVDQAGRYVIVDGTVESVGETKRTIYLNFGGDYRTDFTALVRRNDARGWGDGLTALKGARVRIRGVLEAWNGGLIRIEHPAQIERAEAFAPLR